MKPRRSDTARSAASLVVPHRVGLLVILLAISADALAATGGPTIAPPLSARPINGLRLTLDTEWVETEGYRPIRATVSAAKPANFERTLTIQLECRSWYSSGGDARIEKDLDLPAGATTASTSIAVPWFGNWSRVSSTVLLNGRPERELSAANVPTSTMGGTGNIGPVRILIVGPASLAAPNLTPLHGVLVHRDPAQYVAYTLKGGNAGTNGSIAEGSIVGSIALTRLVNAQDNIVFRPAAELPTTWLDYSGLDIVYVPMSELANVAQSAAWEAILRWTATGGNLAIQAGTLDEDFLDRADSHLAQFALSDRAVPTRWSVPSKPLDWPEFDAGDLNWQGNFAFSPAAVSQAAGQAANGMAQTQSGSGKAPPLKYLWRRQGLGRVLLLDAQFEADSMPDRVNRTGKEPDLAWPRFAWNTRQGFSSQAGSEAFWWHLVPGVGLPPVVTFCVLITLFAILIGPVNYFFLRSRGRLYLLLISVPASAALVAMFLIGYAIASDGLSSRVRVRSFTLLDQEQESAVCWSWLSYYCGLSPGDGLTFPSDVAVFPLESDGRRGRGYGPTRSLQWSDAQRLPRGWLAARTPTQYVTVRSRTSAAKIRFDAAEKPQQAENKLGSNIQLLIVCDQANEYHVASNIPAGASVRLEPLPAADALGRLAYRFNLATPQAPAGIPAPTYGSAQGPAGTWSSEFETGLMEQAMQAICPANAAQALPIQSGTYVAIVDMSPEVVVGIDANQEASFHVVQGRW